MYRDLLNRARRTYEAFNKMIDNVTDRKTLTMLYIFKDIYNKLIYDATQQMKEDRR